MLSNTELDLEKVGQLGIICMPGCEAFAEKVQRYIQGWRNEENRYIIKAVFPRFASGEGKGLIKESMRGKDVYIITDIFNISINKIL